MNLPYIRLDEVYHVGALDQDQKASSYEGQALSVSRCPEKWADGHLDSNTGLYPVWSIDTSGLRFLDESSLVPAARATIIQEALERSILETRPMVRMTFAFRDGVTWTNDAETPLIPDWAAYNDQIVSTTSTRLDAPVLTTSAMKEHGFKPATGWWAEWSAITIFARQAGFDGSWQRYDGCRTDLVHPHGCLFRPQARRMVLSHTAVVARTPFESLPPPALVEYSSGIRI